MYRQRHIRMGFTIVEFFVCLVVLVILIALIVPATRFGGAREAARRSQCKNNFKQIGLALHNYHEVYKCFPPAYMTDASGRKLHSWRTLILPYVGAESLHCIGVYEKIDLSKPWDDPVNAEAAKQIPSVYQCPSITPEMSKTVYVAIAAEHAFLSAEKSRTISEITDGTSNTVAVVEVPVAQGVHWMSPQDIGPEQFAALTGHKDNHHTGGGHMLLADGSVRFVSENLDAKTRMSLTTVDGGETIGEF